MPFRLFLAFTEKLQGRNHTPWLRQISSQVKIIDSYFDGRNVSVVLDKEKSLFRKAKSFLFFCNIGPLSFQCDDFLQKHKLSSASSVKKCWLKHRYEKRWLWREKSEEKWFQRNKIWYSGDTVSFLVFLKTSSLTFQHECFLH